MLLIKSLVNGPKRKKPFAKKAFPNFLLATHLGGLVLLALAGLQKI